MNRGRGLGKAAAAGVLVVAIGGAGCMGGGHARAVRLYDGPHDEAAVLLVGDVLSVDGTQVPARAHLRALARVPRGDERHLLDR